MEPILINRCTYDKDVLTEMTRAVRRTSSIVLSLCAVVLLGVSFAGFFAAHNPLLAYGSLFLSLFFFYMNLLIPVNSVKLALKRYWELYHAPIESELRFLDESVQYVCPQTQTETAYGYADLKLALRTKNLYILRFGERTTLLAHKSGFEKGDGAALEALLRQKAVHAKIKF